nr:MAG TPA: hypothetical protein [Caudoviricetes sp.]
MWKLTNFFRNQFVIYQRNKNSSSICNRFTNCCLRDAKSFCSFCLSVRFHILIKCCFFHVVKLAVK